MDGNEATRRRNLKLEEVLFVTMDGRSGLLIVLDVKIVPVEHLPRAAAQARS